MAYTLTKAYNGNKEASVNSTQFTALVGGTLTLIECATATFITNEVEPGDGAVVASSTSNNGTHVVQSVLSETLIVVAFAGTTEAGAGTVVVQAAAHTLLIENEATVDWATIATNVGDDSICSRKRTSGQETGAGATASTGMKYWIVRNTIITIRIHNPAAGIETVWTGLREIVYRPGHSSLSAAQSGWQISHVAGDSGSLVLELGELSDTADRDTMQNGCALFGFFDVFAQNEVTVKAYASLIVLAATNSNFHPEPGATGKGPGQVFGCLVDGQIAIQAGAGTDGVEFSQTINMSSGNGILPQNTIDVFSFHQAQANSVSALVFVTGALLAAMRLGNTTTPMMNLIIATATFLDPQEDYTFGELMQATSSATGKKAYTWTPTFMTINDKQGAGEGTIEPVSGIYVEAEYIEITRIVQIGSANPAPDGDYTVTINGTNFTHAAVSQSASVIGGALTVLINAGAEPVVATNVKNGSSFDIAIIPDDLHVAMTIELSSPSTTMTLKANSAAVTGFPDTTDVAGQIGSKTVEVVTEVKVGSTSEGLIHKMLRYNISHPQFEPFQKQIYLTAKTTETVYVEIQLHDIESELSPSI